MKLNFKDNRSTAENIIALLQDDIYNIDVVLGIYDKHDMIDALYAMKQFKIKQIEEIKRAL